VGWNFAEHCQLVLGCSNILDEEPKMIADNTYWDYGTGFYSLRRLRPHPARPCADF
jgi:hypothetical protein